MPVYGLADDSATPVLGASDVVAEVRSITPSTLEWSTGSASLGLTAGLADTHRVEVALAKSAVSWRSSTRSARSVMNATTAESFEFDVVASCGAGLVTSDRNGRALYSNNDKTSGSARPYVRYTAVSSWTPGRYSSQMLQVEICRVIAVEAGGVCEWVSTTLNSGPHTFAKKLRDAGH